MINFNSKLVLKLMGYFFLNSKDRKYVNEIARILEIDPGNLNRQLKTLEQEGILISEARGNQKYYFLNEKYPLLKEVKKIYNMKCGLLPELTKKLKNLLGLKEAYIFGSYARDTFQQGSDIDILLIGEHSTREAKKIIFSLQSQFQREFNVVDITEKEFIQRKKNQDEFIQNIFCNLLIKII